MSIFIGAAMLAAGADIKRLFIYLMAQGERASIVGGESVFFLLIGRTVRELSEQKAYYRINFRQGDFTTTEMMAIKF